MISIQKIKAEDTYLIRLEILRKGIDLPTKFVGDKNEETIHLGAFLEGKLIGVATFMENYNELFRGVQYQLRGMAILDKASKKGVGTQLLKESLSILKESGCTLLWCNAREVAVPFYEKQKFIKKGLPFAIPKIGIHYIMYKIIN